MDGSGTGRHERPRGYRGGSHSEAKGSASRRSPKLWAPAPVYSTTPRTNSMSGSLSRRSARPRILVHQRLDGAQQTVAGMLKLVDDHGARAVEEGTWIGQTRGELRLVVERREGAANTRMQELAHEGGLAGLARSVEEDHTSFAQADEDLLDGVPGGYLSERGAFLALNVAFFRPHEFAHDAPVKLWWQACSTSSYPGSPGARTPSCVDSPTRDVPDGRSVGPLLVDHRDFGTHRHAEALGVVGRPARRRDLEHTHVVNGLLVAVEIRILPDG